MGWWPVDLIFLSIFVSVDQLSFWEISGQDELFPVLCCREPTDKFIS